MGSFRTLSAVLAATVVLGASIAISATAPSPLSDGSQDDVYVSPDGSDSTGTGLADAPWRTVSHAVSALGKSSEATLHVGAGTYDSAAGETFPIEPGSIAIVGAGATNVVIDAGSAAVPAILYDGANTTIPAIKLSGVTVKGGTIALSISGCGSSSPIAVTDCRFVDSASHGAEVNGATAATFTDCVFSGNAGHGLYFHGAPSTRLLRCAFVGNTLSGIRGGAGGWGADPGGGCAGTTGSFCYFANNGVNGIHIGVDGAYWVFDHCTILNNGLHGYGPTGEYDGSGIYNSGMLSDSIVAFNKGSGLAMNWAGLTTTNTIFYQNVGGKFGGNAANAVNATGVIESDPALYPYAGRIDGALYCDSPAIGKASDGLNLGCYQGAGMQYPDPVAYYVRPDGNDLNDGFSDTAAGAFASFAPFAKINLMFGDSIHVAAGTYDTAFALSGIDASAARPMRVIGEDGATFECASSVAHSISGSKFVSIEGIAFVGGAGFTVSGSTGCAFTNCVFTGSAGQGVEVANSPSASFTDCAISNNVANGIYFHGSASLRLLRDIFVANGQSGIIGGRGGWGTQTGGDVDNCAGTSGSFCYFARNGGNAIQMNVDNVSWTFDHCTIVDNGGFGFGAAPGATIGTWGTIADCVVAFNKGAGMSQSHGSSTATNTLFYQNAGGISAAHGDNRGNVIDCLENTDPLLCPYAERNDGAVFKGSPVLGEASDGLNIGCYQGEGEEEIVDSHTYYVRPDGDDANDGLANTSVGAFATIACGARALANAGDALFIAAGSYTGAVTIANVVGSGRHRVSIVAEPGTTLAAFADPEAETPATAALEISGCSNFDLSGLTITNGLGMAIDGCSGFTISNIVVEGTLGTGLVVSDSSLMSVADSIFRANAGHGVDILGVPSADFLRCTFARNALCGLSVGNRAGTSNLNMSYCYFGFNGTIGFGYALAGFGGSVADHCTFVKNGVIGYGDYSNTGHNPQSPLITNSLFVANCSGGIVANMGVVRSPMTMFWSNGGFDLAVTVSAGDISKLEDDSHIFGVDPLLCDWYAREDGALYAGSPAIGAADDGSNLGCYQGAGEALPAAKTYYVSTEGSDANDGLSAATAFATLSNACDRALGPGDTIRVAAGSYSEPVTISGALGLAAKPVRIIAESGATLSAAMRVVDSACVELSGLAFTGVTDGAGLAIEDSVQVAVRGCSATGNLDGVRTDAKSSNISFADCEFSSNTRDGIAVTASPDVFLEHCRLVGNGRDGIYSTAYPQVNAWKVYADKGAMLRQCLLADNGRCGSYSDSVVVGNNDTRAGDVCLESCVVCGNGTDPESPENGGVFSSFSRHPYGNSSVNTIIAFNNGAGICVRGDAKNENYFATNSFDCIYGNTAGNVLNGNPYAYDYYTVEPGEGTITVDPLLRDPANGNYRISAASPCVNAGTNQAWMVEAFDFGGRTERIADIDKGGIVDIGLYEVKVNGTLIMIK